MNVQHITLIGMSNIGKSTLAGHIAGKLQYVLVDCDPMVNEEIMASLHEAEPNLKLNSIEQCADWMGQPGDKPGYDERADLFVASERAVMVDVVNEIIPFHKHHPVVVDTCGSVIYTGPDVLAELKKKSRIIYLAATEEYMDGLSNPILPILNH